MEEAKRSAPPPIPIPAAVRKKITLTVTAHTANVRTGQAFPLHVTVVNGSDQSISNNHPDGIFLSYHWVDAEGNYAPYEGLRTGLPRAIPARQRSIVKITVVPPTAPGTYQLQVGLLQKQVSWFESDVPDHLQILPLEILEGKPDARTQTNVVPAFAEDRQVQLDYPPAIFSFELTNQCPFKCIMCARTNNMTRAEGLMAFATFQKALDEFLQVNPTHARTQEVWLHGFGESLVHPEFAKFMRYATDRGVNAGLSINPLMLKKKVASDLLDANPGHLYIALDGHDNASFEKIRGVKDAYDKSKRRLLSFLEEKQRRGVKTRISLSMIDFPNNQGSIHEVADFWANCEGIDEFVAKPFVSWDGKAEDVNLLMGDVKRPAVVAVEKVRCDFPWTKMTVAWDGELVPCCFDYNKKYTLGNINTQSLTEIWNGEKMHALRREFIANKVENALCNGCEYLYQAIVPEP